MVLRKLDLIENLSMFCLLKKTPERNVTLLIYTIQEHKHVIFFALTVRSRLEERKRKGYPGNVYHKLFLFALPITPFFCHLARFATGIKTPEKTLP